MAKLTTAEFIEAIKELSVMELNELVKACEEEFGVSAAAGVVVAAGPAAAAEEEKTEFDVELTDFGAQKIKVIKVVREIGRGAGREGYPQVIFPILSLCMNCMHSMQFASGRPSGRPLFLPSGRNPGRHMLRHSPPEWKQ